MAIFYNYYKKNVKSSGIDKGKNIYYNIDK